jgi:hypothetical protein
MNESEAITKAQIAFDKTIDLLHDYRTGAEIGGNAMKYIIDFAREYKEMTCQDNYQTVNCQELTN